MDQLPTEALTGILVHLPYESLLRAMGVCRRWKEVIGRDPKLRLSMFKLPNEPMACEGSEGESSAVGTGVTNLGLAASRTHKWALPPLCGGSLDDYAIIHDSVCIPATKKMTIIVARKPQNPAWKPMLYITVDITNPKGVRVGDVFDAMARASGEKVHHDVVNLVSGWSFRHPLYPATLPPPPLSIKADMLGSKRLFVGLVEAVWKSTGVEATAYTVA
ncbi:hypothetical protein BD779DRAFT_1469852 [Infundibulicybe gibba]|nr:hypothetical protein BD779DRAFT_1469852 [Infundibulicybe gibba]